MFVIEAIHPNDIFDDDWKELLRFSEQGDLVDHLAYPSFDWYPGMIVRVVDEFEEKFIYTGIFGENECIDAGYVSDLFRGRTKHSIYYYGHKEIDFPEYWKRCPMADEFMDILSAILSKETMIKMLIPCVLPMLSMVSPDESCFENSIKALKLYPASIGTIKTLAFGCQEANRRSTSWKSQYAGSSIHCALLMVLSNNRASSVTSNIKSAIFEGSSGVYRDDIDGQLCAKIRSAVPLYEIAREICISMKSR